MRKRDIGTLKVYKAYSRQDMAAAWSANASLRSRNAPRKRLSIRHILPTPNPSLVRLPPLSPAELRSASACATYERN